MNPFAFDQRINRTALERAAGGPARVQAGRGGLPPGRREVVRPRLGDLSPEHLVAPAEPGRLPGRGAHAPVRHADLRAVDGRSRGHLAVRPKNRHNIALYASQVAPGALHALLQRGRAGRTSRVTHYDIDVALQPGRRAIEGRAQLAIVDARARRTNTLTVRLADSLDRARSVVSNEFGRLLFVRVRNQNASSINLPARRCTAGSRELTIEYGGPLDAQPIDREAPVAAGTAARRRRRRSRSRRATSSPTAATGTRSRRRSATPPPTSASPWTSPSAAWPAASWSLRPRWRPGPRGHAPPCASSRSPPRSRSATSRSRHAASRREDGEDPPRQRARSHEVRAALGRLSTTMWSWRPRRTRGRRPRQGPGEDRRRHPPLLLVARRRLPLPGADGRAGRAQLPGGHSPAYLAVLAQPIGRLQAARAATTPRRSRTSPSSSSRTSWPTSGGARRSGGRTTTSSG